MKIRLRKRYFLIISPVFESHIVEWSSQNIQASAHSDLHPVAPCDPDEFHQYKKLYM